MKRAADNAPTPDGGSDASDPDSDENASVEEPAVPQGTNLRDPRPRERTYSFISHQLVI
jgi:hypothetical protein